MRVIQAALPGVLIIEPDVYSDPRGFFLETYNSQRYLEHGIGGPFLQDNHSRSVAGTLRGLHLQTGRPQGKLVRVISGAIFDVGVDVRRGSPTFGEWVGVTLSAENFKQVFIPAGFAHGFCVFSGSAEVEYKCTELYEPASELGIAWDDPALSIKWPVSSPLLSDRDKRHCRLSQLDSRLPEYSPAPSSYVTV